MKKILLVAVGVLILLVGTLVALDKYVDDFTLFPDDLESDGGQKIDDDRAATKVIPTHDDEEQEPDALADEGGRGDDEKGIE